MFLVVGCVVSLFGLVLKDADESVEYVGGEED